MLTDAPARHQSPIGRSPVSFNWRFPRRRIGAVSEHGPVTRPDEHWRHNQVQCGRGFGDDVDRGGSRAPRR